MSPAGKAKQNLQQDNRSRAHLQIASASLAGGPDHVPVLV
jgi:hypothetical protein